MEKCLQHTCHLMQSRVGGRKQFAGNSLLQTPAPQKLHHAKRACHASMGLGFTDGLILPRNSQPKVETATSSYGLSTRQMAALGLTEDSITKPLEANEVKIKILLARHTKVFVAVLFPYDLLVLLTCRSLLLLKLAIAQTKCTKTHELLQPWVLARVQPQGRHPLICLPCCWMDVSATLECL